MTGTRAPRKTTTAKKTTPKKTTPGRRATSKKPLPSAPTTEPATDTSTVVDLRHPLPVRRRNFVGPHTPSEQEAASAALASASLRLPIPVSTWNGSTAQLADGTLLIHNPGPDRIFTAHIACRHGAIHGWPIRNITDLREARALTHACERPHGGINADQAINHGVNTSPPKTRPVLNLNEGIRRTAETQPLSLAEIAAGIAATTPQTPDTETAKEHPQP